MELSELEGLPQAARRYFDLAKAGQQGARHVQAVLWLPGTRPKLG